MVREALTGECDRPWSFGFAGEPAPLTLREARETVERRMVQEALRRHAGKITPAALELGISRPTLYELIEKLAIARE